MEVKKLIKNNSIYLNKLFFLNSVDLSKIVVSSKWKINDTKYKYFCGYLNNDIIQRLCVILPQMSGYIKYFDDGEKICRLLRMIKKFIRNIMKYGK